MSKTLDLAAYVRQTFVREPDAFRAAREASPGRGLPAIHCAPEDGLILQTLARAAQARTALEIGTLGGYSGCWIASALPAGGTLHTLEYEQKHADVAAEHFAAAGVADRVRIHVGDAHQTLATWQNPPTFDFVFIDAEKTGYPDYLAWAVAHTRPGAWIICHNALHGGRTLLVEPDNEATRAIQRYNAAVGADPRLSGFLYPGGDGMTIALRLAGA